MPKQNPHRPFAPSSDQMALAPQVSGNTINGLGETTPRNPSIVYWATNPDTIAHGELQKWFYTVDPCHPDFAKERAKRTEILNTPLPTKSPVPAELKPKEWLTQLSGFVDRGFLHEQLSKTTLLLGQNKPTTPSAEASKGFFSGLLGK